MRWTDEQDRIMRETASRGAEAVAKAIKAKTGVSRSISAVKMHASRIGVSLMAHENCPRCGMPVKKLHRDTGLCPRCNKREKAAQKRSRYSELMTAVNSVDKDYPAAVRDYNAARRQLQRAERREIQR